MALRLIKTSNSHRLKFVKNDYKLSDFEGMEYFVNQHIHSETHFLNLPYEFKEYIGIVFERKEKIIYEAFKECTYEEFQECRKYVDNNFKFCYKNPTNFIKLVDWFSENLWKSNTLEEGLFLYIIFGFAKYDAHENGIFAPNKIFLKWGKGRDASYFMTEEKFHTIQNKVKKLKIFNNSTDFLEYIKTLPSEKVFFYSDNKILSNKILEYLKGFKGKYCLRTNFRTEFLNYFEIEPKILFKYYNCHKLFFSPQTAELCKYQPCIIIPYYVYKERHLTDKFKKVMMKYRKHFRIFSKSFQNL